MLPTRFVLTLMFVSLAGTASRGATVMYILGNEVSLTEGNAAIVEFFEARNDTLEYWDNTLLQADPEGALDAADAADLVFIDESVSSSRADAIIETTTPVINNEQYAFDNWGLVGPIVGHGSPNRPNADGLPLDAGSSFGTTLEIVDSLHPIAARAGLSGLVQVYDDAGGRLDWGRPVADADVVAQLPGFETYQPASTLFVYEAGSNLANGTTAAGMRIGYFISDTNRGPEPDDPDVVDDAVDNTWEGNEATLLTDAGWKLLSATVDYALGLAGSPGDFNGNGVLDSEDIDLLTAAGASQSNDPVFDLNGDTRVDDEDVQKWVKELRHTWMGDADIDGEFTTGDLVIVLAAGKFEQNVDAVWTEGDWNADGRFTSGDLVTALSDGGFENGPRPAVARAVPEPSGATLCLGLLTLTVLGLIPSGTRTIPAKRLI